jgi:DNA-binding response OmpR family regulator
MPKLDGFETLARLRGRAFTPPILMLSTLHDVDRRVEALAAGADDYIGKPFDLRELMARVSALLRRHRVASPVLRFGSITVDLQSRTARRDGAPCAFTGTEYALLEFLAQTPGKPVPRTFLLEAIWGYPGPTATRTVETHIWRLRKKLGDCPLGKQWIRTAAGIGYALSPDAVVRGGRSPTRPRATQPRSSRSASVS